MAYIAKESLASIHNRETLFAFLNKTLSWPLDHKDTFTYADSRLSSNAEAKVQVRRIVPYGADDPFVIMLCEFETQFRRAELREILRRIREQMRTQGQYPNKSLQGIIFICAINNYSGFSFAHFQQRDNKQPKLSTFGWETDSVEETRTLLEFNLPALKMQFNKSDEPDWDAMRERWLSAWDVERVSNDFYRNYEAVFKTVEEQFIGHTQNDKRLFAIRLFNRLLFLQFVQKKKWLRYKGSSNYLQTLYKEAIDNGENFYRDRLYWLFFCGLGSPAAGVAPTFKDEEKKKVVDTIGEVPYLNGGLFQCEDVDDHKDAVQIDNRAFDRIITALFCGYNFTLTESEPLDVDVAVDPEMLGSIFEKLVTNRHDTGSYYTPKPIVSFMCREALKGYLSEQLPEASGDAIAKFVDEHDPSGVINPERALQALKSVRVCDPACGSGAYLLGMLHELLDLRACLFTVKQVDAATVYERKLEIIQNNLYGVDSDQFAVNIARLRLWLSLVVDDTRNPIDDPDARDAVALPNLDFKIERGDSVICPNPQPTDLRKTIVDEYVKAKEEYLLAHNAQKHELYKTISDLRMEIALMDGRQTDEIRFDWSVDFAEIFNPQNNRPGGFDIIVANPPYIRHRLIKPDKPALKGIYDDLFCSEADLYVYFYLRAIQMLREGGMLSFISSNKWLKARYGEKLRKHVADNCTVTSITDFGDLPVFQNATAYAMIFIARKGEAHQSTVLTDVESLDDPYPNVHELTTRQGIQLPESAFAGSNWTLADSTTADILEKMRKAGTPLGEYVNGKIYYGLLIGFNKAFIINSGKRQELIDADPKSAEIINPLIVGKDVRKWRIVGEDNWIISTKVGIDMNRYPAIMEHLQRWQPQLEKRQAKGDQWWELRSCKYYDEFDKPKIVHPDICKEPRFTLADSGYYVECTAGFIASSDLFLLGLLNSASVETYYRQICASIRGGYLRFKHQYTKILPVPCCSSIDMAVISGLVQKCLDARGECCEEWEREIDERVAALYGL